MAARNSFTYTLRRAALLIAAATFFLPSLFFSVLRIAAADTGYLKLHFIDVGQADATYIEFPDGKNMIIDAGYSAGYNGKLIEYLDKEVKGVKGFDYVMLTHSDADHCNGLSELLAKYPVKEGGRVYRPNEEATRAANMTSPYTDPAADKTGFEGFWGGSHGTVHNTVTYKNAIERMYAQTAYTGGKAEIWVTDATPLAIPKKVLGNTLTLYTGMDFYGGANANGKLDNADYAVRFYAPTKSYYADVNNYSPVFTVNYRGHRALISGDAEKEAEAEFVRAANAGLFDFHAGEEITKNGVNVIKLGHHGSSTSSSKDYLNIVLPSDNSNTYAIASANRNGNNYNHPHTATLNRLTNDFGLEPENILVTEQLGSIVITFCADGVIYGDGGEKEQPEQKEKEAPKPSSCADIRRRIFGTVVVFVFVSGVFAKRRGHK